MAKKKKEVELKEVSRTEVNGTIIIKYEDGSIKIIPAPIALTAEEAQTFLQGVQKEEVEEDRLRIYVDGSFHAGTGEFSYGMVVLLKEGIQTFHKKYDDKELAAMHNVAGEIKGAEAAMRYAMEHGIRKIAIYHDYEGIAKWCLGLWKTNKEGTRAYKSFYDEASRQVDIQFVKVAGHSGDTYNEMADQLAKEALGI